MHEVEPGGMGHQFDADRVGMQFGQHRIDQARGAGQDIGEKDQRQFEQQQFGDGRKQPALPPLRKTRAGRVNAGQAHHFIDDELAHIERSQRLQGRDQPQADAGGRQPAAGAPDLRHQPAQMPQIGQALFEAGGLIGEGRRTPARQIGHDAML